MNSEYVTLKNRALSIHKMIKSNKKKIYPIPYLNDIYADLDKVYLDFISKHLIEEDIDDPNQLFLIKKFIDITNESVLSLLQNASHIRNPKAITIPIREKFEQTDSDALYLPELIWNVNYYIGEASRRYNDFINNSLDINYKLNKKIYRFGIPHFYQDNVLMSGIIGHELGHYLDLHSGLNISEKLLVKFSNNEFLLNDLKDFVVSGNGLITDDTTKKEIIRLFIVNRNLYFVNWLNEFVADSLGVILYGPCSIFSSEYLIQSVSLIHGQVKDGSSVTHPRNVIRSKFKLRTLNFMDYSDEDLPKVFLDEIERNHKKWIDAESELNIQETIGLGSYNNIPYGIGNLSTVLERIEEFFLNQIDFIVKECREAVDQSIVYTPSEMIESINVLSQKIGDLLPPNDLLDGKPSDSISIINAGWLAYLNPSDLLSNRYSSKYEQLETINNLLERALEVSFIHRRWLE